MTCDNQFQKTLLQLDISLSNTMDAQPDTNTKGQAQQQPDFSMMSEHSDISSSALLDQSFQTCANAYDICVHFISKADGSVQSEFANAEDNLTLEEVAIILIDKTKRPIINVEYRKELDGKALDGKTLLSQIISGPAAEDNDLYLFYETIQPVIKQVQKQVKFQTLNKYSYTDEKKYVKIYLELEKIGLLPPDKIHARFLDRSFEIKIFDYNGKNWIFAVPKTQCAILTKDSKITIKANRLIVSLGKMAEADNWFSLHKTKMIGQKQLD